MASMQVRVDFLETMVFAAETRLEFLSKKPEGQENRIRFEEKIEGMKQLIECTKTAASSDLITVTDQDFIQMGLRGSLFNKMEDVEVDEGD